MTKKTIKLRRAAARALAVLLAAAVLPAALPVKAAAAGASATPVCDEAYYATLDCYGGLSESSVVKTYLLNGATSVTDYGTYDNVKNLTNDVQASVSGDAVTFDFGSDAPDKFYFQGSDPSLYEKLPWSLSVSYKLNGVAAGADELAGKTGMVEIDVDALPNANASEYMRDNYVLEAMAMFNEDDILSVSAPGAQTQLVGNIRVVLFMALPGEEQHFSLSVGSNDFSFDGLTVMMVPATLSQLDKITDLRNAKEKTEDSYNELSQSIDTVLNSLDSMSGTLSGAASGLDSLDAARAQISAGKSSVYAGTDAAIASLDELSAALGPLQSDLNAAGSAVSDATATLKSLTDTTEELKPALESARADIEKVQKDTARIQDFLNKTAGYEKDYKTLFTALNEDAETLSADMDKLSGYLTTLSAISKQLQTVSELGGISYSDSTAAMTGSVTAMNGVFQSWLLAYGPAAYHTDQQAAIAQQIGADSAAIKSGDSAALAKYYKLYGSDFGAYVTSSAAELAGKLSYAASGGKSTTLYSASDVAAMYTVWKYSLDNPVDYQSMVTQGKTMSDLLKQVNGEIATANSSIDTINTLVTALKTPLANTTATLSDICAQLGRNGDGTLGDDVAALIDATNTVLGTVSDYSDITPELLSAADGFGTTASAAALSAEAMIDRFAALDSVISQYEPAAQQGISDLGKLSGAAASAISGVKSSISSLENLLKSTGPALDAGTQQSLEGISAALRSSADALGTTDSVRDAKDSLFGVIDDEWASHTGGSDNMLLMDPNAAVESLTSAKNSAPQSVQVVLRTAEIKTSSAAGSDSGDSENESESEAKTGNFFTRFAAIFVSLWRSFTGLFRAR